MGYFDSIYAAGLKLSCSTVRRALRDLERSGWLETSPRWRENGSCSSNSYRIR